jgi:hypothetical protein
MPGVEQMRRREFDGAVVAWPLSAHAKQPTERMRGRVLVAGLIILLCLAGLGFIDPDAIAQEVAGQYRWRVTMDPTVLTVEQEKAKAAKPGSDFMECARRNETGLVRAAVRVKRNTHVRFDTLGFRLARTITP